MRCRTAPSTTPLPISRSARRSLAYCMRAVFLTKWSWTVPSTSRRYLLPGPVTAVLESASAIVGDHLVDVALAQLLFLSRHPRLQCGAATACATADRLAGGPELLHDVVPVEADLGVWEELLLQRPESVGAVGDEEHLGELRPSRSRASWPPRRATRRARGISRRSRRPACSPDRRACPRHPGAACRARRPPPSWRSSTSCPAHAEHAVALAAAAAVRGAGSLFARHAAGRAARTPRWRSPAHPCRRP